MAWAKGTRAGPRAERRPALPIGGRDATDFIDIRDDRFARLIHGNAGLDRLWTGGRWCEGPAYFPAGRYLIWSDIPNDRLLRWDECSGEVAVFEQPCRNQNGHTVDAQGRLVACEHRGRSSAASSPTARAPSSPTAIRASA